MAPPGSGTGFPSFVNAYLPPGLPGDFAGANIRANVVGGAGDYAASPGGVTVGVMGYADPTNHIISTYYRPSSFLGFVHRDQQALITNFLGVSGVGIVGGDMTTLMSEGDFWGFFTSGATVGQKVYANPVTGALTSAATGNSVSGAITAASIAVTGIMTVGTITGTPLAVGQVITGAGVPAGSYIASLGTGTGGTGTYNLANVDGTAFPVVSSEAMTYTGVQETQFYVAQNVTADTTFTASLAVPAAGVAFGVLTVTAIAAGTLVPGQWISANGGTAATTLAGSANIQILSQLTGTAGSTGTYLTNNVAATVTSTNTFVATQGKVGKISTWATTL